jgi:hypothetical protein
VVELPVAGCGDEGLDGLRLVLELGDGGGLSEVEEVVASVAA